MTDNKKVYSIEINGIEQSIKQVDALIESLKLLDEKVKAVEARNLNISATEVETQAAESPNYQSRVSELQQEDALLKQIEQTEQKIAEVSRDEYQELLHQKDVLKELKNEGASRFAEDNLAVKEYSNTMAGLKERLADVKKAMQFKEIGSESFNKLSDEANQVNNRLKELEQSYGQYGRNVGNYANGVAEGMQKFKVTVGGVTREFKDATAAAKELGRELKTMSANGQKGTEEFKELDEIVAKLNSDIKDTAVSSNAMDSLLDSLQTFSSIGQVTQGFSALFGFDDTEIERSIQKLVALQNVVKGIESIRQQMKSGELFGGWIEKGNDAIDSFVEKMFGAKEATEAVSDAADTAKSATEALGTATKGATTATEGMTVAQNGLTKATKKTGLAVKATSMALKALGIGLIIAGVTELIGLLERWAENQKKAAEEAEEAAEKIKKAVDEQRQAYVNASAQYMNTASRLSYLRAEYTKTNNEAKKTSIIKEAASEFKKLGISVNSVTEAQRIFVNDGDKVIQLIKLQGDAAAVAALRMEAFKNSYNMLLENGYDANAASILAGNNKNVLALDKRLNQINDQASKLKQELKIEDDFTKKSKELGDKRAKDAEETQKTINQLELRLMSEGLNKKLMQLDEEKRQTLNKLKNNSAAYLEAERLYAQLRLKEVKDYFKNLEKEIEKSANNIKNNKLSIDVSGIKEDIKKLEKDFEKEIYNGNEFRKQPIAQTLVSSTDYSDMLKFFKTNNEKIEEAKKKMKELEEERKKIINLNLDGKHSEEVIARLDKNEKDKTKFEKEYAIELNIIRSYAVSEQKTLKESFEKRYNDEKNYFLKERKLNGESYGENFEQLQMYLWDRTEALKEQAKKEKEIADNAASGTYETQKAELDAKVRKVKNDIRGLETNKNRTEEDEKTLEELKNLYVKYTEQYKGIYQNYKSQLELNKKQHSARMEEIDKEEKDKMSAETEKYFQTQISNFRDFNSKMSNELSKTPTYDKAGFGIINLSATKKQYKEIQDAAVSTINNILTEKNRLDKMLKSGFISNSAYNASLTQLNDLEATAKDNLQNIEGEIQELGGKWWGSINQWVQQIAQTASDIMGSLSEITANRYEREISQQEKYIQEYSDLLDKQKDKTQEYASAVDSIEAELSTARGDRRQHLIDQLNAEMAAQRASLAQEKKIEKEREKAEEKKKKLEHDQAVAKKKMDLAQAAINTAMAISMAAVNKWPVPAIPMMALAAAAGAAQYAAVASQNIPSYGSGGVLLGKSHKEGGIKVLGGRAEVEGGEFITNKLTTTKNVEVLEYINSKRRKLNLEDFVDFYGGKKSTVKKNVQSAVKTKFADGGVIPTLRNDIELSDRLLQTFEDYSNRPVQVAVVDIIDGTQRVNDVRVMAGIES